MFLVLVAVFCFITLLRCLILSVQKPFNYPPGPSWLPVVGSLPHLKKLGKLKGSQHEALNALSQQFNTNVLGLKLGGDLVVVVFSYAVINKVLTGAEYDGRPDSFFMRLRSMGTRKGITGTDGDLWYVQRHFVVQHLRHLGFGKATMETKIKDELTELLKSIENNNCNTQIGLFLAPAIINVLWSLTAGNRIDSNDPKLQELLDLMNLRRKAFDMTGGVLSQYPWLRFIAPNRTGYSLVTKLNAALRTFFMQTIDEHYATWHEGAASDLIYAYISEMKAHNDKLTTFTNDQLLMVCLDLFIAGSQTTSNTLDFAFMAMVLYPEIQKKVHAALDDITDGSCLINYSDRFKVPYVEAVLMEVERYYFVVPITGPRRVLRDTVLEGYNIPKNTTILIHTHSVHNDPSDWHNSKEFNPDRFLDKNGKIISSERLLPFGKGKRRCIGEALAKSCIFVFFANIMKRYSISIAQGDDFPTGIPLPGLTLTPEKYRVNFLKRAKF